MNRKLLNIELNRLSVAEFKESKRIAVVVVMDNVRSAFNIGAAFRSGDAFGIEKIVLCGICATPPSAEIHKSALGAELSLDWNYYNSTKEAIAELKQQGYTIISIEQAEHTISLENLSLPISEKSENEKYALVFGNEVHGVEQDVVNMSDFVIEIPQIGTKHSINVSVSVGIILWEFFKILKS